VEIAEQARNDGSEKNLNAQLGYIFNKLKFSKKTHIILFSKKLTILHLL